MTDYKEMIAAHVRVCHEDLASAAIAIELYLEEYSEETTIGMILRKLILWNNAYANAEQRFLFRSVLSFGGCDFMANLSSMISHDLLDDGALLLIVHPDGRREFVKDSLEGCQDPELVLSEINRVEENMRNARRNRVRDMNNQLIAYMESKNIPVTDELRARIDANIENA